MSQHSHSSDKAQILATTSHQAEHHRQEIAVAAYYLAERRQFEPGHEVQDWLAAENEVAAGA